MHEERKKIIQSFYFPAALVVLIWVIKLGEILTRVDLVMLGVYPRKIEGMIGILASPLIHSDLQHLFANSIPLFVLGSSLIYFYKEIALRTFFLIYLLSGIAVWAGAREAYHIGASGVVYGLASFLFFSGIIRRDVRLLAITMLVTFLYGSMVWGIFPELFPEKNISWESHLWGLIVGLILAMYFRKQGPQRKKYEWEYEEEGEKNGTDPTDNTSGPDIRIRYFNEN